MGIIDDELQEIRKLCEHVIPGSRLVSCVQSMVRVEIRYTTTKTIVVCIQFPSGYPKCPLLIELKSKFLSARLLDRLCEVCEVELKQILGKPQVLFVLKFIHQFLKEKQLSCCYDEIITLKSILDETDEFKLKQKSSCISLKIEESAYYFESKILVPENYPEKPVRLQVISSNFPISIVRFLECNAAEIARQCVEPPSTKKKSNESFHVKPSLEVAVKFLIQNIKKLPHEACQICSEICLPAKPEEVENDETADKYVERVYCGHLFHLACLVSYMKTPPFKGGKKCTLCGEKIFTHKWRVNEKLAEDRWAHHEARQRELEEVEDFLS